MTYETVQTPIWELSARGGEPLFRHSVRWRPLAVSTALEA